MPKKNTKTVHAAPKKLSVNSPPNQLYDVDFVKWANTQAKLLKNGDLEKLDLKHLREEIEALGRNEKNQLKSHLENQLMHMLKIKYQPKKHTRSWDLTIKNANYKASCVLKENPSLKPKLKEILQDAYSVARIEAAIETNLMEEKFPEDCPWVLKDIFPDLEKKYC